MDQQNLWLKFTLLLRSYTRKSKLPVKGDISSMEEVIHYVRYQTLNINAHMAPNSMQYLKHLEEDNFI